MKPEEPIFADVLDVPPSERAAFLDRACGNDAPLRARVDALLRAYDGTGTELEASPIAHAAGSARATGAAAALDYVPGMRIGRYKLLQQLGEGGCGVVFMAEQEEAVRRRVALKVIKLGMDTREVIARFEAERQALALMDHPNIAHVLDAGATESGRPYFVMELVRGIPLTRHCDEHQLGTRERLRLFIQICSAIQHAHQKGIIHRDLKPSNILVTLHDGVAVPKIIDFGIAKAMHGRLTDKTLFTAFEQFIGTPAYMSPEQTEMSGLDVDTRSDIYSLGVLLYELLTGRTPFESQALVRGGLDEMRRTIREREPAKPSSRVSTLDAATGMTIARQRGTDPAKLRSWLRGDVDWIVMRCLEKDRTRRYETANGLAMDLERYLRNEPVTARPPGTAYVLRKLIRRNKLTFAAGGAVLFSLIAGLAFSTRSFLRERAARQQADVETARSAQVARLMQGMLAGVGPQMALGRDTKMLRAILDETDERLHSELRGQPELEAGMRETLGNVYRDLREWRSATLQHETALRLQREIHGTEHPAVAGALANLAETLVRQDRLTEAETMLRDALAMRVRWFGPGDAAVAESQAALENLRLRQRQKSEASSDSRGPPAPGTTSDERPAVIRLAISGGRSGGQPFHGGDLLTAARQQGVLEKEFGADGIRVEWSTFQTGAEMNEAFARDHVDFARFGGVGARAAGLHTRMLLALSEPGQNFVVVRADSPFHSLADLKGGRFGTVMKTVHRVKLCCILEKNGFRESDYILRDFANGGAILTAFLAGELDGHLMSVPFDLEAQGVVRVIYDAGRDRELAGAASFGVAENFAGRYPAVVQRVVNALVKTAAWSSDEHNRDALLRLLSESDRSYEAITKTWAGFTLKEKMSPLMDEFFFARLRRTVDDSKRFGLIETDVSVDDWAEPTFLQRALVELKLQDFWPECDAKGNSVGGALRLRTQIDAGERTSSDARLVIGASAPPDAKPTVIRIAHTGGRASGRTFNAGNIITTARGLEVLEREFKADGIRVEWTTFSGGAATNEALTRKAADFGYLGLAGAVVGRAQGLRHKLLLRAGLNGSEFAQLVVNAASAFRRLEDLKGRRLATIKGTAGHLTMCRILEKHGLSQTDFEIVNLDSAAAVVSSVQTGDADGIFMSRPEDLEARGVVRVVLREPSSDTAGLGVFWVSEEFERRYPRIVQRAITAIVKLAQWNSEAKNRDAVFEAWTKDGLEREEMERNWTALPLKERYSPLLDGFALAGLRAAIADARRFGLIETDVSLDGWIDPKYLQRALAELGLQDFWPERDAAGNPKVDAGW